MYHGILCGNMNKLSIFVHNMNVDLLCSLLFLNMFMTFHFITHCILPRRVLQIVKRIFIYSELIICASISVSVVIVDFLVTNPCN